VTRLVLIPSYNTGGKLFETVAEARRCWEPVWVVIDGSTDGTGHELMRRAEGDPGVRVFLRQCNEGKGAAILYGLRAARDAGFTQALTMDADGQHAASIVRRIPRR
jgi:glycosyltransferase involved in cell wall biosynthesis